MCIFAEDCPLGIGEFFVAAVVAAGVDELLGFGEIGGGRLPRIFGFAKEEPSAVEVNVGQEEPHWAEIGYFTGLVQVALGALGTGVCAGETAQPGAGEEAMGKIV